MPNKTLTIGTNSQLIDINITGSLYADGSNLTNLNATNLSSGTVNWNRLPTSRIYDANTSRTANAVLAAPNGSAGAATFRALVAADIPNIDAGKITSGTLPIARGGTGLTASPSMLTNLGSTTAANVLAASPRPGVTGTLPVANGGTGITTSTYVNAIVIGNASTATNAFRTIRTASGAFYATAQDGAPTFGTLPAAQGGTGNTSLQATRNAMGLGNTTGALPIANGGTGLTASPSMLTNLGSTTAANVLAASPRPGVTGTLPVGNGGTGATTFTSGAALIGNGTGTITTRSITNNTATSTALTANTNLITANTLRYLVNRTTSVAAADTSYTTYMARGAALVSSATNPSYNGQITWQYS